MRELEDLTPMDEPASQNGPVSQIRLLCAAQRAFPNWPELSWSAGPLANAIVRVARGCLSLTLKAQPQQEGPSAGYGRAPSRQKEIRA